MPEQFSSEERSRIMSLVRSKDTAPEKAVRSALHKEGFRFRLGVASMPGKPDIVLTKYRTAIFVHGCLWHSHGCRRFRWPVRNAEYWRNKIRRNQERDAQSQVQLRRDGWDVLIVWDCDLAAELERLMESIAAKRSSLDAEVGVVR